MNAEKVSSRVTINNIFIKNCGSVTLNGRDGYYFTNPLVCTISQNGVKSNFYNNYKAEYAYEFVRKKHRNK